MSRLSYKVRIWTSVGLFVWAVVAFVASVVYFVNTKQLWVIIVMPIVAFISFILSIVFFPRFKDDGSPTAELRQKSKKLASHKPKKSKKPFTSEKEWEELDEEDEECMYIDEGN